MLRRDPALVVGPAGAELYFFRGILQLHIFQKHIEFVPGPRLEILDEGIFYAPADDGGDAGGIHHQPGGDRLTVLRDDAPDLPVLIVQFPEGAAEPELSAESLSPDPEPADEERKMEHGHIHIVGLQMVVQCGLG